MNNPVKKDRDSSIIAITDRTPFRINFKFFKSTAPSLNLQNPYL